MALTSPKEGFESRRADDLEAASPYLVAARTIAAELAASAVESDGGITWLGDDIVGDDPATSQVVRGPVGSGLYDGLAGIAWFLSHALPVPPQGPWAGLATRSLTQAVDHADNMTDPEIISLYGGGIGVGLAATEAAQPLQQLDFSLAGHKVARRAGEAIERAPGNVEQDFIGGLAGTIIGLLAVHRRVGDPDLLQAARIAGQRLVKAARREWWGWSWADPTAPADAPGLCGLAHGASGIAWALAELGWTLEDKNFVAAADEALRYERSWFAREECAWPDLREPSAEAVARGTWPGWMTAWCHGAIGIGMVRLRWYEVTRDLTALAEATAAIHATRSMVVEAGTALRSGEIADVTLCHGLSGAAELFLLAHEVLGQTEHLRAARRVGDLCLDLQRANGGEWSWGVRNATYVPGLFLGLAGIGVTMLRLHDPCLVGSPALAGRRARVKNG